MNLGQHLHIAEDSKVLIQQTTDTNEQEEEHIQISVQDTSTPQQVNKKPFSVLKKFTEEAKRAISFAEAEAQRFQHDYIGTEHLLLGLAHEKEGIAAQVLKKLGINLKDARNAVGFINGLGSGNRHAQGELALSEHAKKAIIIAIDEARRQNYQLADTEHLLLGLMRMHGSRGIIVLRRLSGVDPENVIEAIRKIPNAQSLNEGNLNTSDS
jgi:ATP-dependent Clp protease ATP-binding subunit ClpA